MGLAVIVLIVAISYSLMRTRGGPAVSTVPVVSAPMTTESIAARARQSPRDPVAWMALGNAQFGAGDFAAAAGSFSRATSLDPGRADLWSALGEARVMASKRDPMPPDAVTAFQRAVAIDPRDPRARYFLAVRRDLAGEHQGAIDDWLKLLADTPPGAPWEADLRRTIEQVGKINGIAVAARIASVRPGKGHPTMLGGMPGLAVPGPSADDMRAAAALSPSQQDAMARTMVARLEAKLAQNPANVDGWLMLMRSQVTLGAPAKASAARDRAIAANPDARADIERAAATLGVGRP